MALPPVAEGALQLTTADPRPIVALTEVGAPGTVAGTTLLDPEEASEVPVEFVALTVK
jgi:hypothetical protein